MADGSDSDSDELDCDAWTQPHAQVTRPFSTTIEAPVDFIAFASLPQAAQDSTEETPSREERVPRVSSPTSRVSSDYSGFGSPGDLQGSSQAGEANSGDDTGEPRGFKNGRRRSSLHLSEPTAQTDLGEPEVTPGKFKSMYKGKLNSKSLIGTGKFSMVYRVSSKKDKSSLYAAKVVTKKKLTERQLEMTKNEAAILQLVGWHEHIGKLVDYYSQKKINIFVLEMITGGELFDEIMTRGSIAEVEIAAWIEQLLSALSACHDRFSIVHRDVKLENLMLTGADSPPPKVLKLVDFGLAAHIPIPKPLGIVGSPPYVAPEVLKEEPYGKKIDCWSVGVVLYTLLGGCMPFVANDRTQLFDLIIEGQYGFPEEGFRGVSKSARSLVDALLTYRPSNRMSATEALNHPWIQNRGTSTTPKQKRSTGHLKKARHSIKMYREAPPWLVVDLPPEYCESSVRSMRMPGAFLVKTNSKSASYTIFVAVADPSDSVIVRIEVMITRDGELQLADKVFTNVSEMVANFNDLQYRVANSEGKAVTAHLTYAAPTWFVDFPDEQCHSAVGEAGPGTFVVRRVSATSCQIFANDNGRGVLRYRVDVDPTSNTCTLAKKRFKSIVELVDSMKISKFCGTSGEEVVFRRPPWG